MEGGQGGGFIHQAEPADELATRRRDDHSYQLRAAISRG
jgi:hypothetical protein